MSHRRQRNKNQGTRPEKSQSPPQKAAESPQDREIDPQLSKASGTPDPANSKTEKPRVEPRSWIANAIQFGLLIVGVAYCTLTYGLWSNAQASLRADNRAWLALSHGFTIDREPIPASANPGGKNQIKIAMPVSNTGKTPALNVYSRFYMGFVPTSWLQPPEPDWNTVARQSSTLIMAGEQGRQFDTAPYDVIESDGSGYEVRQRKLYVWTLLTYCDVFHRPHWTKTCVFHVNDPSQPQLFSACQSGSYTDDWHGYQNLPEWNECF
jgi:hypothetical protein